MKKLALTLGMVCLFMVACNNAPKQQEQPKEEPQQEAAVAEEHHCPFCSLKAEYAKWETMEDAAKVELNNKAIALFAEMDAKMDAVMEKWANIASMTNDEQKDLVLERIAAMGMGQDKCDSHEGEEHHCGEAK